MTDTHATRLRRICRRLPQLLGRAARLMLALMLVPSLAWGQTMDEMKQMLQQLGEYFVDEDGARTGTSAINTATGLSDRLNLWEITTTVRIKLLEKLFARLEYRHDQSVGRVKTAFDKKNLTFSRGQQDTVGVELYYQF